MEAAVAFEARHGVRREQLCEGILVPATRGERRLVAGPKDVVQDRGEPKARGGLGDDPRAPAEHQVGCLADRLSDFHQLTPA
jgi:hypothetical protein